MNQHSNKPNDEQKEDREQRKAMGRWVKPCLHSFQRSSGIASGPFLGDEGINYNPTSGPGVPVPAD